MRLARIKGGSPQGTVYHCMSRVVGGQHLLDDLGKRMLVGLLFAQARFCGVEVITYCMMSNHFHLLVRIPETSVLPDGELLLRAQALHGPGGVLPSLIRGDLRRSGGISPGLRRLLTARMGDVSAFMKEFKQRFSRWYNARHQRFGTLWAERFKSVLVEDAPDTLRVVATYIDLNPVRAGLVSDPKDYRYCGYAAALAGRREVRAGLMGCLPPGEWRTAAAEYRMWLFVRAGASGRAGRMSLGRERILAELKRGGRLSLPEILRLRIRHLSDGVALGSREFVEGVFLRHRHRFGPRRKSGARPLRFLPQPLLSSLRDLRVDALR